MALVQSPPADGLTRREEDGKQEKSLVAHESAVINEYMELLAERQRRRRLSEHEAAVIRRDAAADQITEGRAALLTEGEVEATAVAAATLHLPTEDQDRCSLIGQDGNHFDLLLAELHKEHVVDAAKLLASDIAGCEALGREHEKECVAVATEFFQTRRSLMVLEYRTDLVQLGRVEALERRALSAKFERDGAAASEKERARIGEEAWLAENADRLAAEAEDRRQEAEVEAAEAAYEAKLRGLEERVDAQRPVVFRGTRRSSNPRGSRRPSTGASPQTPPPAMSSSSSETSSFLSTPQK